MRMPERQELTLNPGCSCRSECAGGVLPCSVILVEQFHEFHGRHIIDLPSRCDHLACTRAQKCRCDSWAAGFLGIDCGVACGEHDQTSLDVSAQNIGWTEEVDLG